MRKKQETILPHKQMIQPRSLSPFKQQERVEREAFFPLDLTAVTPPPSHPHLLLPATTQPVQQFQGYHQAASIFFLPNGGSHSPLRADLSWHIDQTIATPVSSSAAYKFFLLLGPYLPHFSQLTCSESTFQDTTSGNT